MVFDSETDSETMMDLLVFEKVTSNAPACKRFQLSNPKLNALQQEHIDGILNNYSSLFEVISIDSIGNTLVLEDLLDANRKEYVLMDIGLSKTARLGFIFYTRLIPIRDINMTSGVSFIFERIYKDKLLSAISLAAFKKRRKTYFHRNVRTDPRKETTIWNGNKNRIRRGNGCGCGAGRVKLSILAFQLQRLNAK